MTSTGTTLVEAGLAGHHQRRGLDARSDRQTGATVAHVMRRAIFAGDVGASDHAGAIRRMKRRRSPRCGNVARIPACMRPGAVATNNGDISRGASRNRCWRGFGFHDACSADASTRPVTRSGRRAANSVAIRPPYDTPAITARSSRARSSARSTCVDVVLECPLRIARERDWSAHRRART